MHRICAGRGADRCRRQGILASIALVVQDKRDISYPSTGAATAVELRTGIVAIGRNERARLVRCFASLRPTGCPVVYFDSGSTDGSDESARAAGAGMQERLTEVKRTHPGLEAVLFIDGDCDLAPSLLPMAERHLSEHCDVTVASGRRRKHYPEVSPYNRIMDAKSNTPIGETLACGGDALVRLAAYRKAGGFDPALIAYEEPERAGGLAPTAD